MVLLRRIIGIGALLAGLVVLAALIESRRDPVVRSAYMPLADWPAGAPPVRVALFSDIHIGNLSTDAARLQRVVAIVNAQRPDLVLIAGDFIAGTTPGSARWLAPALVAPLRQLHAPLGVVAVPGNHDHATGLAAVRAALAAAHVELLAYRVVRHGPVVLIGLDDGWLAPARLSAMLATVDRLGGARLALAHFPDMPASLPPDLPLLAGHTHCGQIVLPGIGPVAHLVRPEMPLGCGVVRSGGHVTIITAGIGTSGAPMRIGAPPDLWVITLGPARSPG